ncbi:MAG TPA: hypothetical protein ENN80_10130 [Candidatus Hydrogenedentes bacterium]|nr:hypothetical protein [Candidatus Hydrogenedentota bacterium]
MENTTRAIILTAMVIMTIVSMCTTYMSLKESVLPDPTVDIPIGTERVWSCAFLALGLSVAIGLMLFALKIAIVDEQKRLNAVGVVGLIIIAFISITFNMDVFYRVADREFFLDYSNNRMRSVYEHFLSEAQALLTQRRDTVRREIASQQGELEAEIEGLRQAPEGYGPRARQEDYRLKLLEKTAEVELATVEEALDVKTQADALLRRSSPQTIEEIHKLQEELRVIVKDLGALANLRVPDPVKLENPLFAVFQRLFDFKTVGFKEILVLLMAIFLDLGDIVGYSLVPNKKKKPVAAHVEAELPPHLRGPEFIPERGDEVSQPVPRKPAARAGAATQHTSEGTGQGPPQPPLPPPQGAPQAIRFRRRK